MRDGRQIYIGSRYPDLLYDGLEAAGIRRGPGVTDFP